MRKLTLLVSVLLIACADKLDENKRAELLRIRTDLGAGYLERNQLDIANQELQKAFAINSNDSQANNIMGLLQARMKNYDKADKYFRKAISAQPDNSDAQNKDRKSTRLNSSHPSISYAAFCLKQKKKRVRLRTRCGDRYINNILKEQEITL